MGGGKSPPFTFTKDKKDKMNCETMEVAKRLARKLKRETGNNYCVVQMGDCWDVKRAVDCYGDKVLYTTAND